MPFYHICVFELLNYLDLKPIFEGVCKTNDHLHILLFCRNSYTNVT